MRTMKTQILLVVISTVITQAACSRYVRGYKEAIESCNDYIDTLLTTVIVDHREILDSYSINDSVISFQKKVIFVDFKGEARLSDGYISGVGSLRRTSPCSLSFENARYKLGAELQTDAIFFNSTGSVKVMNMGPIIFISGNSSSVDVSMAFTLNSTSGREALLEEFKVQDITDTNVWLDGLRLLGWMSDPLKRSASTFFKSSLKNLFEGMIRDLIAEKIMKNPFSIEEFDVDMKDISEVTDSIVATTSVNDDDNIPEDKREHTKEDSDSYVDSVLENRFIFETAYSKLDPYSLDDVRINNIFQGKRRNKEKQKYVVNNYLDLKHGQLENLSRVKRISDCTKPIWMRLNVTFVCYLGFDELEMKYDATSSYEDQVSTFEMIASIASTRLSVKITSNYKDNVPTLLDFTVHYVGRMTVKRAEVIASSYYSANPFNQDLILQHISTTLQKILNGRFKDVLSYSIYKTPLHFLNF